MRSECRRTEDAEIVLVGYGIVGRVLKAAVEPARARGLRLGLLRPITLYPVPLGADPRLAEHVEAFAVVEMSTGQLVDDVRLALEGRRPVEFFSRVGGNVPSAEEVLAFLEHNFRLPASWSRGADPWLTTRLCMRRPRAFYDASNARPNCSTRRITALAAAMALCTSCWPRPSTSWASRTGPC